MTMVKNILVRALNSFMYSVGITVVCQILLLTFVENISPVMPEFGAHFANDTVAMLAQILLIGLCSAVFGGGSVIMELERIGFIVQSVIYFVLTAAVWVPVACVCWGIHKYWPALLSVSASYLLAYVISWSIQYKMYKKSIAEINLKLSDLQAEALKG